MSPCFFLIHNTMHSFVDDPVLVFTGKLTTVKSH